MAKFIQFVCLGLALYYGLAYLGLNPLADDGKGGNGPTLADLEGKARAAGKKKIVILLTGTSWCPYCVDLDQNVIQKAEWKQFIGSEAVFASYEYGAGSRPRSGPKGEMLKKFKPEGFPTMVVLNRNGTVLDQQSGYHTGGLNYYKFWISSIK